MTTEGSRLEELIARVKALVSEAAQEGLAERLAPTLEELARETRATLAPPSEGEFPGRFGMIGESPAMEEMFALLVRVIASDVQVLINGETGTGKELVARALHEYGPRKGKPFIAENCAAVPAQLLESELFGHKKGSFTDATSDRKGHFVTADKGTIFLDEIGDMAIEMQAKLLRVLQDGEVRPVGGDAAFSVDVRLVAATNKDLPAMCREGGFREDLYFRLNVINILLPPLREREGDVRLLARYFAAQVAAQMGRPVEYTEAALQALESWEWPGNVRELENEIQRDAALSEGVIDVSDLSPRVTGG